MPKTVALRAAVYEIFAKTLRGWGRKNAPPPSARRELSPDGPTATIFALLCFFKTSNAAQHDLKNVTVYVWKAKSLFSTYL